MGESVAADLIPIRFTPGRERAPGQGDVTFQGLTFKTSYPFQAKPR